MASKQAISQFMAQAFPSSQFTIEAAERMSATLRRPVGAEQPVAQVVGTCALPPPAR